jgi:putative peptidoglycan lipid II flippase
MATGLIGKFSVVGIATMISRFLGFFREALIAAILGAGPVADAFYAAFRFPNLFRRLFAEGAFNAAFVPLFARELEGGGREAARRFGEQVLSVLLCALIAVSALAMIFMPFLVKTAIAARFDPFSDKFELTVVLARIMFPYLAAMSLVAMLSGILNAFRRYFLAALAPVILNIVLIAGLLAALATGLDSSLTGLVMAWSVFLSGFLQLALLIYGVRREGFALRLRSPVMSAPVRRLLLLAVPAAITGGITQINLLIGQNIASAKEGAIAILNYADRLFQLPLGVVGVAIGVVLLPELARTLKAGDFGEAGKLQDRSLEFGMLLTVPAAVGFAIMPEPLIALVYERGAFTRETTHSAASVLAHFAWGLPAATLIAIFRPGFYAREDMRTPMWYAAANVATNVAGSLYLFPLIGIAGIAIATSAAQWVNALLLGATLWTRSLFRPSSGTLRNLVLLLCANLLMGLLVWILHRYLAVAMLDGAPLVRVTLVGAVTAAAAFGYFAFLSAVGVADFRRLRLALRRNDRDSAGDSNREAT